MKFVVERFLSIRTRYLAFSRVFLARISPGFMFAIRIDMVVIILS